MAFTIDRDVLRVNSRYAWVVWIFHAIFLLIFPPAILAMWKAGPDKIPLWFNLIFTGLFFAAGPFLLGEIAKARLVRATLDRARSSIDIVERGLLTRSRLTRSFEDIDRIEMRTSDNDGYFHTLHVIFRDGEEFAFRHGNHRESMEEERDRFLAFLRALRPDVQAVEKQI